MQLADELTKKREALARLAIQEGEERIAGAIAMRAVLELTLLGLSPVDSLYAEREALALAHAQVARSLHAAPQIVVPA